MFTMDPILHLLGLCGDSYNHFDLLGLLTASNPEVHFAILYLKAYFKIW